MTRYELEQRLRELVRESFSDKADANFRKWGFQPLETLTLAATEELGELAQAVLKHEDEELGEEGLDRIAAEARDLGALCVQIIRAAGKGAR